MIPQILFLPKEDYRETFTMLTVAYFIPIVPNFGHKFKYMHTKRLPCILFKMDTDTLAKILWGYMHMYHVLEKADAIFVLGSSDERVAEYAAKLYLERWAPLIIFSGGRGETSFDMWGMTEAEKFASIAINMGVPETSLLLEKRSTNTGENIRFTKELLEKKNVHCKKFILVQKPYMERRTYATFMKQWPDMD